MQTQRVSSGIGGWQQAGISIHMFHPRWRIYVFSNFLKLVEDTFPEGSMLFYQGHWAALLLEPFLKNKLVAKNYSF